LFLRSTVYGYEQILNVCFTWDGSLPLAGFALLVQGRAAFLP